MHQIEPAARPPTWRAALWTLLVALFVARLTLLPASVEPLAHLTSFFCILGCGNDGLRDLISNVILFLPVGWVVSCWVRPRPALLICLLVTVFIEGMQVSVISGRDSSLRDILSNTAGGAAGIWGYLHWPRIRWPAPAAARRLALGSACAWLILLWVTALGLRPAPTDRPWYGQWTPDLGNYLVYPGRLLDVDLAGQRPPDGRMPEPVAIRQAMREERPWIVLGTISGAEPRRTALIFGISDDRQQGQLFVGQDRIALLLHLRNRFEAWGLREIIARQPLFPGRNPGDTVTIEAGIAGRALTIHSRSGAAELTTALPLTVGLGWSALMPMLFPVYNEWILLNGLWLAALILPAGYWAGRWSPARAPALLALVLLGGLGIVPYFTHAAPTTHPEWYGAALGAALGWAAGFHSRRRASPAKA